MKKLKMLLVSAGAFMILAACGEAAIEEVDADNNDEAEAVENEGNDNGTEEQENEENNHDNTAGDMNENNGDENEDNDTGENQEANEEEIDEDGLGIGSTVDFNGLHVTLKEGRKYAGDGEWEEPENDYFIILDVSIENTADEEANISTMMQMDLVDPDGYSQDMDFFVDTRGSLDGEVGAGRTMAGEISFDVEEAEYYEFIFEDPFMSGQAIWLFDTDELQE